MRVLQEWGHDVRIFCGRSGDAATAPYQIPVERGEFPITRVSLSPRDLSGDLWHYDNRQITQAFTNAPGARPAVAPSHEIPCRRHGTCLPPRGSDHPKGLDMWGREGRGRASCRVKDVSCRGRVAGLCVRAPQGDFRLASGEP